MDPERRKQLQARLEEITEHVYFQPPANVKMEYPCIVYQRDAASTDFAGNLPYRYKQRYQLTVIDRSPDSLILSQIVPLPECLFNRHFVANNLNHDVFTIYF